MPWSPQPEDHTARCSNQGDAYVRHHAVQLRYGLGTSGQRRAVLAVAAYLVQRKATPERRVTPGVTSMTPERGGLPR